MDKYDEVADRLYIDLNLEGQEDLDRVIAILREAFPAQKASDKPQSEASEELGKIRRILNETDCDDGQFLEIMDAVRSLASRPTPTTEKVLREVLGDFLDLYDDDLGMDSFSDDTQVELKSTTFGMLRKARAALAVSEGKEKTNE